jgi:membrane-bound lytic murein transglycosylase D
MKRTLLLLLISLFLGVTAQISNAQNPKPEQGEFSPKLLTPSELDSLTAIWQEELAVKQFEESFGELDTLGNAVLNDSIYIWRLRNIISPIRLPYHPVAKPHIAGYSNPKYERNRRIMSLSLYYFPMIEEELTKAGLPIELRILPIIESNLTPTAYSHMGAAGLWQFMPATGKNYGLEINSFVDERLDPVLSTRAACKFLKYLYKLYGDWSLAIAAYNCGHGNVNKALARAGGGKGKTFWDVYEYLPNETRGYFPAFIGASYGYAYHREHGIEVKKPPMPIATDTVRVARLLHLGQVAEVLGVPIETLKLLNPQYLREIIPAKSTRNYTLTLPQQYVSQYVTEQETIHKLDSVYLKEFVNPANVEKKILTDNTTSYTVYTVKSGDTLGAIAGRYRVTTAQIMKWNKLKNANKLSIGQKLRIEGRK